MKTLFKADTQMSNKRSEGFTIIEVLIVLAIAGLIMLIVFLAVPALQRNSRNVGYKNEARRLLSASTEFTANSSTNALPAPSGSGTSGSDAAKIFALANPRNITTLTVELNTGTSSPTLNTAILRTSSKCTSPNAAGPGPTKRVALLYPSEDASGNVIVQCTDS